MFPPFAFCNISSHLEIINYFYSYTAFYDFLSIIYKYKFYHHCKKVKFQNLHAHYKQFSICYFARAVKFKKFLMKYLYLD